MSQDVVSVPSTMPVASAAALMAERGLSALPVISPEGVMLGIVSELDLIRRLSGREDRSSGWLHRVFANPDRDAERYAQLHGSLVEDVMTRDVISVSEDDRVEHAAHVMEEKKIRRLPVLRGGQLMGIISRADLLRALLLQPTPVSGEIANDASIRAAILREIREHPWADSIYVSVTVENGVVEFGGFARSTAFRHGLSAIAHGVPGVREVKDTMSLMPFTLTHQS
jgi:CBS domain-containing protein